MFGLLKKDPLRNHMQSEMSPFDEHALRMLLEGYSRRDLRIMEIGSWFGAGSTTVFADYAATIVCVDHWRGNENPTHRRLASELAPFAVFRTNTKAFRDKVVAVHSDSSGIQGLFREKSFDLVFIDGDHRYAQTRADIINTLPLVKSGGILCGHDCEGRPTPENEALLRSHIEDDHTNSVFVNFKEMHPGVILAVDELLDNVTLFGESRMDVTDNGRVRNGCSSIWWTRTP